MTVRLLRHAPTQGNLLKRYIGSTDEPLCGEGRALAERCGRDDILRKVYVSPRIRTQQTAAIWFPNAAQVIIDGLAEMDFGIFENRSYEMMREDADYCRWLDTHCEGPCPGGEDKSGFSSRVCEAYEAILRAAEANGETEVVMVAHGGTIMAIMDYLSRSGRFNTDESGEMSPGCSVTPPEKKLYFDWQVKPCEGFWLTANSYEPIRAGDDGLVIQRP
jgi:alpha-ribazole phosphatase